MFKIMFKGSANVYHMNDITTAADVIMGTTGNDLDYKRTAAIMGNMTFGDTFYSETFMIKCVKDEVEKFPE
jgi:hypothetical protein